MIDENYYPDYDNLNEWLLNYSPSLHYTPQLLFNFLSKYFSKNLFTINYDITNRLQFYVITLITITILSKTLYYEYSNSFIKKKQIETLFLVCLLYPSALLAITASSAEAIYNVLIFFLIITFQKRKYTKKDLIKFLLFSLILFKLDPGNFTVFTSFFSSLFVLCVLRKLINVYLYVLFFLAVLFVLFNFGEDFFYFIGQTINSEKTNNLIIEKTHIDLVNIDFSEIVLRYIYFWFTLLVLHFPVENYVILYSGLIGLILISLQSIYQIINHDITRRKFQLFFKNEVNQITYIWMIVFPFLFINILPTHAFYKYLVFFIVFIIRLLIISLGETKSLTFISFISGVSIFEFLLRT